jgi:hypothetical protein
MWIRLHGALVGALEWGRCATAQEIRPGLKFPEVESGHLQSGSLNPMWVQQPEPLT